MTMPIYLQVIEDIKKRIVKEELHLGERLPSVRDLAVEYKINPNTASRIYREMEIQGLCFTKRGLGTYITDAPEIRESIRNEMAGDYVRMYIRDMKDLGYQHTAIVNFIEEALNREDEKNA